MFTNPFVQSQQMFDSWSKMTQSFFGEEHVARMDQMAEQMAAHTQRLQGEAVTRTRDAIDETARLMKESLTYATELSGQWHKITLDATKRAADAVAPSRA
jgi:hypothetical protein